MVICKLPSSIRLAVIFPVFTIYLGRVEVRFFFGGAGWGRLNW